MQKTDTEIANEVMRGKKDNTKDSGQPDSGAFLQTALDLQAVLLQIKDLTSQKEALTQVLLVAQDTGAFDPETVKGTLSYGERDNGFSDDLVPMLKDKGYKKAVKTKETVDKDVVEELVAMEELDKDEVERYRKAKSRFYQLPRGK